MRSALSSGVPKVLTVGDFVPSFALLDLLPRSAVPLLDLALLNVSAVGDAVPPLPILLLDDLPDLLDGNESVGELVLSNGFSPFKEPADTPAFGQSVNVSDVGDAVPLLADLALLNVSDVGDVVPSFAVLALASFALLEDLPNV